MRARVEIKRGSQLNSEIYNRVSLQDLQEHDLIFHQSGQGRRLPRFVAQPRHFLAGNCENVEALPQALAEREQLDSCRVTHGRGLLMHEAVQHESP